MRIAPRRLLVGGLGAAALLALTVAPQLAEAKSGKSRTKVNLENVGPDLDAGGTAELLERSDRTRFRVKVKRLDTGRYELLVGGIFEGYIDVNGLGEGEIKFRTDAEPNEDWLPLGFDPRNQVVEVAQGATVFLAVIVPDTPIVEREDNSGKKNRSNRGRIEIEVDLIPTGALSDAEGKIRFRSRRGRDDVRVEIEQVPDGSYGLLVDGSDVGEILVEEGEGELQFDTRAKRRKLPLTFDPRGLTVEVTQGDTVILEVLFPEE